MKQGFTLRKRTIWNFDLSNSTLLSGLNFVSRPNVSREDRIIHHVYNRTVEQLEEQRVTHSAQREQKRKEYWRQNMSTGFENRLGTHTQLTKDTKQCTKDRKQWRKRQKKPNMCVAKEERAKEERGKND